MSRLFLLAVCLAVAACGRPAPPEPGGETSTAPAADPRVEKLVAAVSEERLSATLTQLVSVDTRFTASNPDPAGKGIGAARQWIHDELKRASPKLQVSFDTYNVAPQGERILKPVELRNVMAVLPGRSPRRIYVTAHYDSLARIDTPPPGTKPAPTGFYWSVTDNPAPGANDDGSGTALTIELARVFAQSGVDFEATLVFLAFAGEEEGLLGAHLHAEKALTEKTPIDAVFNNDIVGGVTGGTGLANTDTVRVFSEGPEDSRSRQLARHIRKTAERYVPDHRVMLIARYDRFSRGGDHIAFNDRGFTAIRFTEAHENYGKQHRVEDTLDGVSFPYLARNARVNAAGVATLALAPPAPVVTTQNGGPRLTRGESGYDARLQWEASPGAASYRVYSRQAWAPDWEQTMDVGSVTEYVRPNVSIDDVIFGVSAVGSGGHESLVSAYVNPPRRPVTVKTLPD